MEKAAEAPKSPVGFGEGVSNLLESSETPKLMPSAHAPTSYLLSLDFLSPSSSSAPVYLH